MLPPETSTTLPPDPAAVALSQQFFCSTKSVLSGNVALFFGFLLAAGGMWQVIQGRAKAGLILIIAGALLTAAPNLVMSALKGVNSAVQSLQISPTPLNVPPC